MSDFMILIVDDDEDLRLSLKDAISSATSYTVEVAEGGPKALEILKEHSSSVLLVITDYKMPEMTGLELREAMLDKYKDIPVIVMSGYVTREMAMSGLEAKIAAFIPKPINHEELFQMIEKEGAPRKDEIEERKILEGSFIEESQSIIEELEPLILSLESEPDNIDTLNTIFRLVHTVKGASGVLDKPSLTNYLHKYEDLLQALKSQKIMAEPAVITVLLQGFDGMTQLVASVEGGEEVEFDIEEMVKAFVEAKEGAVKPTAALKAQQDTSSPAAAKKKSASKKEQKITIPTSMLDEFLEQSGEITVIRNMINKIVVSIEKKLQGDASAHMLADLLDEMHKINSYMQNMIVDLRKVPISKVMKTIPRAVRDVARSLGKKVELEMKGDDLRVDNSIGQVLSECLIHLVRNAVDHGLEMPDVRRGNGKDETGHVEIACSLEGEDVVIRLSDDGAGIDPERIKKKLRSMGYEDNVIAQMSDQRIYSSIFESGFSTAKEVTDVSGRGVGMDMVRTSIEAIGGRIDIDSQLGQGTRFTLNLPIPKSVLIISSMLVKVKNETFLIPQDDVIRLIHLKPEDVKKQIRVVEGGMLLDVSGRLLPILSISRALDLSDSEDVLGAFVVVGSSEHGEFAVAVDEILDAEDVVVKKFGSYMKKLEVYKGATFMGDGTVALILEVDGLARKLMVTDAIGASHAKDHSLVNTSNTRDVIWIDVDRKGEYGIELSNVFRLEEILQEDTKPTSKYRVSLYRGELMPIFDLSKLLNQMDPSHIESSETEAISTVVFRTSRGYVGFAVNSVKDVRQVHWELKENVVTSPYLSGSVEIDSKVVNIINSIKLLEYFGFELDVANSVVGTATGGDAFQAKDAA